MNVTLKPRSEFFLVRSNGVQWLGPTWPSEAVASYRRKRAATIYSHDRVAVNDGFGVDDELARAMQEIAAKRLNAAAVARCVGKFGDMPLYETVYDVLGDGASPIKTMEPGAKAGDVNIKTVHFRAQKSAKSARRIEGMASTPNVDRDLDIVDAGAFVDSIPEFMQNPVVLWQHDVYRPIGKVVDIEARPDGLWVACEIEDDATWKLIDAGVLRTFSASFIVHDREVEPSSDGERTIRRIKRAELLEVSVVSIPSNRQSRFAVAKALACGDDLVCMTCDSHGSTCECSASSAVVEYRAFTAAGVGPVDARRDSVAAIAGSSADRLARLFHGEDLPPMRHHGVQSGELVTDHAAVFAWLAALANHADAKSSRPLTEPERIAAWKHLARHAAEIGVEVGECPKGPVPELVGRMLSKAPHGSVRVAFASERYPEQADRVAWMRDHGLAGMKSVGSTTDGYAYGGGDGTVPWSTGWPIDEGVTVTLYNSATKSGNATADDGKAPATDTVAAKPKVEEAKPAAADTAAAGNAAADELIEIDSDDLHLLEHPAGADPGALRAAIERVCEAEST